MASVSLDDMDLDDMLDSCLHSTFLSFRVSLLSTLASTKSKYKSQLTLDMYTNYRKHLSKRILQLRRELNLLNKTTVKNSSKSRATYKKVAVDCEVATSDKHITLVLYIAERANAYAMEVKFQLSRQGREG